MDLKVWRIHRDSHGKVARMINATKIQSALNSLLEK